jgi:hypothetical protein
MRVIIQHKVGPFGDFERNLQIVPAVGCPDTKLLADSGSAPPLKTFTTVNSAVDQLK